MIHLFSWFLLKQKYHIDNDAVVIMLPESNIKWNDTALYYLDDFMRRKKADHSFVFCADRSYMEKRVVKGKSVNIRFFYYDKNKMRHLMNYFCLHQFYDKIVFFFLDYPYENKAGYILDTTNVTLDELVCLSFYRLRKVPDHV